MAMDTTPKVAIFDGPLNYADPSAAGVLVSRAIERLGLPADFIQLGDRVELKPNRVKEHDERHAVPSQWEHVITHPAVIEGVIRWVAPRLKERGSITICDAPQTDSSFSTLKEYAGLDDMVARCKADFRGVEIRLLDLRPEEWHAVDGV